MKILIFVCLFVFRLLMNNKLKNINENTFINNEKLTILFFHNNKLTDMDLKAIEKAKNLEFL